MIFLNNLEAVIESIYLEDTLSGKIGECNVFVNPESIKYITSKTVIISIPGYDEDKIKTLISNGCKIVSRVFYDNPDIEVQPYILRLNNNIMWNGKTIYSYGGSRNLIDSGLAEYSGDSLYFPKIYDPSAETMDAFGNLTSIGWALQQVGVNIKTNTCFTNLDIIKTGKVVL